MDCRQPITDAPNYREQPIANKKGINTFRFFYLLLAIGSWLFPAVLDGVNIKREDGGKA